MATQQKAKLTVDEYLEQELVAEFRSEYHKGEVFAMAGTTRRHARIVTNVSAELSIALRLTNCKTYTNDVRMGIPSTDFYTYPDVMVTCGEELVRDQTSETLINPILSVEVLSPSTKDYDRGGKFQHYRAIASLQSYLTVSQDAVRVEHWQRRDAGWFLTEYGDASAAISLQCLAVELKVADLYDKVSFGDG